MENESLKELDVADSIDTEEESVEESEDMEFTDESEEDTSEKNEIVGEDNSDSETEEKQENSENKKEPTKEERALYNKARRSVEDKQEKKYKKAVEEAYQKGRFEAYKGKINPFTNTEIKDITDVEVYEDMYKISENGGDPLKDYASYTADKKREEARILQEEQERQDNAQKDIDEFSKKYPDVNLSELLNDEQFIDYAEGKNKSLVDVYESYNKFTTNFRNKGVEIAKKTIANSISSPGSLSASSENVVDYETMSKEEFEKVIQKVKEG